MIVDYHMHLRASDESLDHTVEGVERFVEAAAARGLDEIGFTEHVYYFAQTRSLWTLPSQLKHCKHDIERYVRIYAPNVSVVPFASTETDNGAELLGAARKAGGDVLVMGAYGRSAWREFVLGGATRSVIRHLDMPVLMAH